MTYEIGAMAGMLIDEDVYGFAPSLTSETPKRHEWGYSGFSFALGGGPSSKTFRLAGVQKYSAEDWGGAEGSTSIFLSCRTNPASQGLTVRMIVLADTNTYKMVLYTTDIVGADDAVDVGSTVFNFDHAAGNQHNVLVTSGNGEVELWVDDVLEAGITTILEVQKLTLVFTNHGGATKMRCGPVFVGSYDSLADRKNAPLAATEIPVVSHTSPQFNEFTLNTPDFANVDDWTNYGATDETNNDAAQADDFTTKRQSYLTDSYTIQSDFQVVNVAAWMATDGGSKSAHGAALIADNGSLSEEGALTVITNTYGALVSKAFNVGPDGNPWDQDAFNTLELGARADQGEDIVNCKLAAVQAEVLDFPNNPGVVTRKRSVVQVI